MSELCFFCQNKFSVADVESGDKIKNEWGKPLHIECYNYWCKQSDILVQQAIAANSRVPTVVNAADEFPEVLDILDADEIG